MSEKYFCDRCGKEYKKKPSGFAREYNDDELRYIVHDDKISFAITRDKNSKKHFDVCKDCLNGLFDVIYNYWYFE